MSDVVENSYGVRVKRCCASCAHKDVTRLMTLRRCTRLHENVRPGDVCKDWTMSDLLSDLKCE